MSTPIKTALVIGLGASGTAAAQLLLRNGISVLAVDANDTADLRHEAETLKKYGSDVLLGAADVPKQKFDLAVVSPGVPLTAPLLQTLQARKVPLLSELEFGWRHLSARTLAITGSNGKSTLAKLCAEILGRAGYHTALGGNYGVPASRIALEQNALDWVVLEVSSFQLETVTAFRPDIAILLNIYPNHLDRHNDFETYRNLKFRIFSAMRPSDTAIVPLELSEMISQLVKQPRHLTFGNQPAAEFYYQPGGIMHKANILVDLHGSIFDNAILGKAAAAAVAAATAAGIAPADMEAAIKNFQGLPHRLEELGTVHGVRFINDSKATNIAALRAALTSVPAPIRLIAGGQSKHEDFTVIADLLKTKVATAYLIGRDGRLMAESWKNIMPCLYCHTLENACDAAWQAAQAGETILLSPACASFDQFRNFEARGEAFRQWVQKHFHG